jgi:hypothetical protein
MQQDRQASADSAARYPATAPGDVRGDAARRIHTADDDRRAPEFGLRDRSQHLRDVTVVEHDVERDAIELHMTNYPDGIGICGGHDDGMAGLFRRQRNQ